MNIKRLGPYIIQDILGRGGMGTVFRAIDENSDQDEVAVKVLSAAYADDEHFRYRFESEIQTLLQLNHPNIVRLLGHGEKDGNLFFAMELVRGKSLYALQKTGHRYSWQEVIGIAMDVCTGLQHAHYRGIIHRDIKPANLLKTEQGTTKITDFGIAKLFGGKRLTAHGGAIGTADYMSPEQAQGQLVTERSDLFSLGCVMYALLSGRPPFAEKNIQSTIHSLTTREATPLRRLSPETPSEFEDLITRLLQKSPSDRFGTAQALNRRLVEMLELIKAEAEAQTALSMDSDDESDEYVLEPDAITIGSVEATQKFGTLTVAESNATPSKTGGDRTIVEDSKQAEDFYTVVDRKKKSSADEYESRTNGPVWPYAVAMVLVLGLITWGVIASLLSEPGADELFDRISQSGLPQERECEEFIRRFPDDDRVDRVQSILVEIESRKLEKKLTLKKKLHGVKILYPIEILVLNAVELRKDNPVLAVEKLDALIRMYEGEENLTPLESETLAAAFFHRKRISKQAELFIEKNTRDIQRALDRAAELAGNGDPTSAKEIYIGVRDSFGDQNWARSLVDRASAELEKIALQ